MSPLEKFLKEQKEQKQKENGATPEELSSARAFAERAATARFGPRKDGRVFNEAAYLASLKTTESVRESVRKYCAARNRN